MLGNRAANQGQVSCLTGVKSLAKPLGQGSVVTGLAAAVGTLVLIGAAGLMWAFTRTLSRVQLTQL